MPKEEPITRTGKRGAYTEAPVTLNLTKDRKYWAVNKAEMPAPSLKKGADDATVLRQGNITDVKQRYTVRNKALTEQRKALVSEITDKEAIRRQEGETDSQFESRRNKQEKEATRRANYYIYETFTGKVKPRGFNFSQKGGEGIDEAKRLYKARLPFDRRKKELEARIDSSERKIYDRIRAAKMGGKSAIAIDERFVNLKDIHRITDKGNRLAYGKPIPKGESVTGYQISTSIIKPSVVALLTGKMEVKVSVEINAKEVKVTERERGRQALTKEEQLKARGRKAKNRITFTRIDSELVTDTDMGKLFSRAYAKNGVRIIYLNNVAFEEKDFYKGADGKWRISPAAVAQLNAPEIDGTISVKWAYGYRARWAVLESRVVAGEAEKAPVTVYGEIKVTVDLSGQKQDVTVAILTIDALIAVKQVRSGNGTLVAYGNSFSVAKQGNRITVSLTGGKVQDTPYEEEFDAKDEILVIGFLDGKFIVKFKTPEMNFLGGIGDLESKEGYS